MGISLSAQLEECPTGTRLLAGLYGLCCGTPALLKALNMCPDAAIAKLFVCSPMNVLGARNLAPILLSVFFRPLRSGQEALVALTELQMAVSFLPTRERELGSLRFLFWLLLNSAGSNVVFLLLARAWNQICRMNQGPWSLAVIGLSLQAMEYPHGRANILGVDLEMKWYPVVLGAVLSVLNGSPHFETFAPMLFAYLWRHGLHRLLVSPRVARSLEGRLKLPGLLSLLGGDWIRPPEPRERPPAPPSAPAPGSFRLFGGQGHRLSD